MNPRNLLDAVLGGDTLTARQWVADAEFARHSWSSVADPVDLDASARAVFAGLVELLAARNHELPPTWTAQVGRAPQQMFLVRSAARSGRMRERLAREAPEPLRKRNVLAPPDFLVVV